jgi:hypothetical protein
MPFVTLAMTERGVTSPSYHGDFLWFVSDVLNQGVRAAYLPIRSYCEQLNS